MDRLFLTFRSFAVSHPVDLLHAAVEAAAAALAVADAGRPEGPAEARAPKRPDTATTRPTPRCCWRPLRARAARGGGAARGGADREAGRRPRARRGRGPGVLEPVPADGWYAARWGTADAGEDFGAGARRPASRSSSGSSRPTRRARSRPPRAPRRLRRFARAAARVRRPRGRARVLRQRLGRRSRTSADRSGRAPAARSPPRTATRATTWRRSRGDPGRRRPADEQLAAEGVAMMIERVRATLNATASTSTGSSRSARCTRRRPGDHAHARRARRARPHVQSEGALWLRTTEFGDDKDRVFHRSTGEPTYFARTSPTRRQARARLRPHDLRARRRPHGYIGRMGRRTRPGRRSGALELLIMQLVNLVRGGRAGLDEQARGRVRHARRPGRRDRRRRARWFMLQRSHDTTIDLDLKLAPRRAPRTPSTTCSTPTRGSPRCCARRGGARRRRWPRRAGAADLHPSDRALISKLLECPRRSPGRRPARAAPDRHLRARARAGVLGVLPRLPGRGRRAGGAEEFRLALSVAASGDRPGAGSARGRRPTRCRTRPTKSQI